MARTVTIIGFDEFKKDMAKLSAESKKDVMMKALEEGAKLIWNHASENARNQLNKHPLGQLTGSMGVRRNGKVVEAGVFGIVYAAIHEFGGIITPRRGPYLVFEIDGKVIRTKKVVIPARPYLRPAVDNHLSDIKKTISDALVALLKRVI